MSVEITSWGVGVAFLTGIALLLGVVIGRRRHPNAGSAEDGDPSGTLAALSRQTSDIVFEVDASGRIDRAFGLPRAGWAAEEMPTHLAADFIHPEDLAAASASFLAAVRGKEVAPIEVRGRQRKGRFRWYELRCAGFRTSAGERRVLVVCRDIQDHRLALAALVESEARYRSVLDQSPLGWLVVDSELNLVTANQAYADLVGARSVHDLNDNLWVSPGLHSLAVPEIVERIVKGETVHKELSYTSTFGKRVDVRAHISPVLDERGEVSGGQILFVNLSESRELEEQLRQSQKMEAVGRLAGGIAHDFNNYLTVILGCGEVVSESSEAGSEIHSAGKQIVETAERSATLTRQLLAFSKRHVSAPEFLNLAAVVEGLTPMLHRLLGETIELICEAKPIGGKIWADPSLLEQVIVNLAVNAGEAMPNGGKLEISVRDTEPSGSTAEGSIELTVRDSGIGIDDETKSRIFEPFFTTKSETGGTGLGLSTVYGIVREMNGSIEIESRVSQGSTFRIQIPKVGGLNRSMPEPKTARKPAADSPNERILLVDDEPMIRRLALTTLSRAGYEVIEAADGEAAIELFGSLSPPVELLLTDVMMPGMNGAELADQIRAKDPTLRILFMSGYVESVLSDDSGALPADVDLLQKPFSPRALRDRVRSALDRPEKDPFEAVLPKVGA